MHSVMSSTGRWIRRAAAGVATAALLSVAAPSYAAGSGPLEPSLRGSVDRALELIREWLDLPLPLAARAPADSSVVGAAEGDPTGGTGGESGNDGATSDPGLGGPGGGSGLMDPNG